MPTNILRNAVTRPESSDGPAHAEGTRDVVITAGRVSIRARLESTATAGRLWAALPLHSTAERWGDSLHFELPIESGRERGARQIGTVGEIYYWSDEDRILIVFGRTPISRPGDIRLPRPCNLLARSTDDVTAFRNVTPGEKVSVVRG